MRFFRRGSWAWPLLSKFVHFFFFFTGVPVSLFHGLWTTSSLCTYLHVCSLTPNLTLKLLANRSALYFGESGELLFLFVSDFASVWPPKHTCFDCLEEGVGVLLGPGKCSTFSPKQNSCQILVKSNVFHD